MGSHRVRHDWSDLTKRRKANFFEKWGIFVMHASMPAVCWERRYYPSQFSKPVWYRNILKKDGLKRQSVPMLPQRGETWDACRELPLNSRFLLLPLDSNVQEQPDSNPSLSWDDPESSGLSQKKWFPKEKTEARKKGTWLYTLWICI